MEQSALLIPQWWKIVIICFLVDVKLSSVLLSDAVKKEVYFMAIIDILTHYDAKKKAAHAAKTVKHGVRVKATSFSPQLLEIIKMTHNVKCISNSKQDGIDYETPVNNRTYYFLFFPIIGNISNL